MAPKRRLGLAQARQVPLRDLLVKPPTVKKYTLACSSFLVFCDRYFGYQANDLDTLDNQVTTMLEFLWHDGHSKAEAANLLCGIQHVLNRRHILSGSWRLYSCWNRVERSRRAVHLPADVLCALCGVFLDMDRPDLALGLGLAYAAMLRTGELLGMMWNHLSITNDKIVISLPSTKIGVRRGVMEFVTVHDAVLANAVAHYLSCGTTGCVIQSSGSSFRRLWSDACGRLLLAPDTFAPYSLRRGGATAAWIASRDIQSVLWTGRWSNSRTARAYLNLVFCSSKKADCILSTVLCISFFCVCISKGLSGKKYRLGIMERG